MQVAVAHTTDVDPIRAANNLLNQIRSNLSGSTPKGAMLFVAIDHDHAVLVKHLYSELCVPMIGCSTDGEMTSVNRFQEDSAVLVVFAGEGFEITSGVGTEISRGAQESARKAFESAQLAGHGEACLLLTTPESLTTSAALLVTALQEFYGDKFPIFGGIAADQWGFVRTFQFHDGDCLEDSLPILVFWGDVSIGFGVSSGWLPIGESRKVSKSLNNVVSKIGRQTAIEFYGYYLGEGNLPMGEYPLAVFEQDRRRYYLRAPLQCDSAMGSISFAGDVPEGAVVQISQASRDSILAASKTSVQHALASYHGARPSVAICISCAARKQLLGTRTIEEYETVYDLLGNEIPVIGFYAYGEISPLAVGEPSKFHNESFVTLLLGRSKDP